MAIFHALLEWLLQMIHHTIVLMGYAGVALLMAIESFNIPNLAL